MTCSRAILIKLAAQDADTLIVTSAVEDSMNFDCVFVVGEHTNIPMILTVSVPTCPNIFLLKPGKDRQDGIVYRLYIPSFPKFLKTSYYSTLSVFR